MAVPLAFVVGYGETMIFVMILAAFVNTNDGSPPPKITIADTTGSINSSMKKVSTIAPVDPFINELIKNPRALQPLHTA